MKLYHHINGTAAASDSEIAQVLADGLQANRGGWVNIDKFLPQRPKGLFFWSEDNKGHTRHDLVSVDTADLDDTGRLYAFPAEAAEVANYAVEGANLVPEAYAFMADAQPVPFAEFKGQFAAEWIYTGDIPGSIICKE